MVSTVSILLGLRLQVQTRTSQCYCAMLSTRTAPQLHSWTVETEPQNDELWFSSCSMPTALLVNAPKLFEVDRLIQDKVRNNSRHPV